MKTKTLDVSKFFENVPTTAIIKKLSFGELIDIKDNTPMGIDKITQVPRELEGQTSALFMQAAIVSLPLLKEENGVEKIVQLSKPTIADVRSIDFDFGTFLIEEIYGLNNLSPN